LLLREAEFVVFDTETTGLKPENGHRICEIGAVKVKNSRILSSYSSLVNPKRDMPGEVTDIHGITQEDVEKAPFFEDVIDNFLEFIGELPLFGYNIEFDLNFLSLQLKTINRDFPTNPFVDILFICRKLLKELPRFSLIDVARFFNIPQVVTHRAYQDSLTAANILLKLTPHLEKKGISSLENIYTIFGNNKDISIKVNSPKVSIIQEALGANMKIKIKYYSPHKDELTEREVIPLRIENTGRKILLVGKCLLREEERSFDLNRIVDLQII